MTYGLWEIQYPDPIGSEIDVLPRPSDMPEGTVAMSLEWDRVLVCRDDRWICIHDSTVWEYYLYRIVSRIVDNSVCKWVYRRVRGAVDRSLLLRSL